MGYKFFLLLALSSSCCMAMEPEEKPHRPSTVTTQQTLNDDEEAKMDQAFLALDIQKGPIICDRHALPYFIGHLQKQYPKALVDILALKGAENFSVFCDPTINVPSRTAYVGGLELLLIQNLEREGDDFKKDNFGIHVFKTKTDPELIEKLLPYTYAYPNNRELYTIYSDSIFRNPLLPQPHQYVKDALQMMHYVIRFEICQGFRTGIFPNHGPYIFNYTKKLFFIPGIATKALDNLTIWFTCLKDNDFTPYYKTKKIPNVKTGQAAQNLFINSIAEDLTSMLSFFKKNKNLFYDYLNAFDALFFYIINNKTTENKAQLLANKLYKDIKEEDRSPALKIAYAQFFLKPLQKYKEAIALYKPILGFDRDEQNFFQTPQNHHNFAYCLSQNKQYKEAIAQYEMALSWNPSSHSIQWGLIMAHWYVGNINDEFLNKLENLIKNFQRDEESKTFSLLKAKATYKYYLIQLGQTEKFTEVLKAEREEALSKKEQKEKVLAQRTKKGVEAQQELQAQKRPVETKTIPIRNNSSNQESTIESCSTTSYEPEYIGHQKEEKYVPPQTKEKKKTRPEPSATQDAVQEIQTPQQEEIEGPHFMCIEDLTDNKNAIKLFNELLFATYKEGEDKPISFNNNVTITFDQIINFYEAIEQKVDKKQGKGSHSAAKMNFNDKEKFGNKRDNVMTTLPKQDDLKEIYIKNLRQAFINAHIIPKRLHGHPQLKYILDI